MAGSAGLRLVDLELRLLELQRFGVFPHGADLVVRASVNLPHGNLNRDLKLNAITRKCWMISLDSWFKLLLYRWGWTRKTLKNLTLATPGSDASSSRTRTELDSPPGSPPSSLSAASRSLKPYAAPQPEPATPIESHP